MLHNIVLIMIFLNSPNNNHLIFLMAPLSKIRNGQEHPKQQSYLFQTHLMSRNVQICMDMMFLLSRTVCFALYTSNEKSFKFSYEYLCKTPTYFCQAVTYFHVNIVPIILTLRELCSYSYITYCKQKNHLTFLFFV